MAIFRRYQLFTNRHTPFNQVVLFFSIQQDDHVMYALPSSIEVLFPERTVEEAKIILESKIGEDVEVNTFIITVKDLTDGVYKRLISDNGYNTQVIEEIKVASVKEFEEEIRSRKILFAFHALNSSIMGVREGSDSQEEIENPGDIFGLMSFLEYNAASDVVRTASRTFGMDDPDKNAIQKAAIKYRKSLRGKYKAKLQHLFD